MHVCAYVEQVKYTRQRKNVNKMRITNNFALTFISHAINLKQLIQQQQKKRATSQFNGFYATIEFDTESGKITRNSFHLGSGEVAYSK